MTGNMTQREGERSRERKRERLTVYKTLYSSIWSLAYYEAFFFIHGDFTFRPGVCICSVLQDCETRKVMTQISSWHLACTPMSEE